ncbi:GGDEF domain-containing protein [Nodosilinea sp. E11]|uniref:GGDEF domain-containing protein n=1 Tax=Nodosilinea sp. E11 TaxID=3037479 RepID=UPI0029346D4F|nr:GGDEF domain-containing protein [Nodosilinea sp. E11]WOD37363.1 GGDEF domain-containing protein [Nodosilinea sp. E11]
MLQTLGKVLRDTIRESDVACRYGGEELTLVFPETTLEAAVARAEDLRQTIKGLTIHYNGTLLEGLSASFGVAVFPGHGTIPTELLRVAESALHQAKHQGRNQVVPALIQRRADNT